MNEELLYLTIDNGLVKIKLINNKQLEFTIYAKKQVTLVTQTLLT